MISKQRMKRKVGLVGIALLTIASAVGAAQQWPCQGSYDGTVWIERGQMFAALPDLNVERLSSYEQVKPLTGGNRVFVYFDVNGDQAADYCLFVYRDEWTLRKPSKPGFFNIEVSTGPVRVVRGASSPGGAVIAWEKFLLPEAVLRCWNFHMNLRRERAK